MLCDTGLTLINRCVGVPSVREVADFEMHRDGCPACKDFQLSSVTPDSKIGRFFAKMYDKQSSNCAA